MKHLHWYFMKLEKLYSQYLDKQLAEYDLGYSYTSYIFHICHYKDIRQDMLAEHLEVNRSSVQRALEHLETHEYITRKICKTDKRKYHIIPTQKAFDVYDVIVKHKQQLDDIALNGLTDKQKAEISPMLKKMLNNVKEFITEE